MLEYIRFNAHIQKVCVNYGEICRLAEPKFFLCMHAFDHLWTSVRICQMPPIQIDLNLLMLYFIGVENTIIQSMDKQIEYS